jgi:hypothetical protein
MNNQDLDTRCENCDARGEILLTHKDAPKELSAIWLCEECYDRHIDNEFIKQLEQEESQ